MLHASTAKPKSSGYAVRHGKLISNVYRRRAEGNN